MFFFLFSLTFTTETSKCECGVNVILNLEKGIQNHGTTAILRGIFKFYVIIQAKMMLDTILWTLKTAMVEINVICLHSRFVSSWNFFILGSGAGAAAVSACRTVCVNKWTSMCIKEKDCMEILQWCIHLRAVFISALTLFCALLRNKKVSRLPLVVACPNWHEPVTSLCVQGSSTHI